MAEAAPMARPAAALLASCLAVLAAQLDSSIVNLVLPRLAAEFGTSVAGLQWVVDAYNLAYAALLLPAGRLADRYGRRRLFRAGLAVLGLASLTCGLAPGVSALVAARAAAGLGAALALPASLAIVNLAHPEPAARGRALGVWAACNGLAMAIGPTAGGWLVDAFGWRSVFLAIVPLPAAAVLLAGRAVTESRDPAARPLNARSQVLAVLVLAGFAAAAIGMPAAVAEGMVTLPALLTGTALASVLAFRRSEAASAAPLLPPTLLRAPGFGAATGATAAMTFGIYGMLMLVPLHLMGPRGLDAAGAGLVLLPCSLVFVLVSRRSGRIAETIGPRGAVAAGLAAMGGGLWAAAGALAAPGLAPLVAALALAGLGLGLTTGPVLGVATAAAPPGQDGMAAALVNVARMAGATLGVAVLGAAYAAIGGLPGVRLALLLGGGVHFAGAALALGGIRRQAVPHQPAQARRIP